MNQFSYAKIKKGKYYLNKGSVVKISQLNEKENRVVLYRYDTFSNDIIEYDTAHLGLIPIFTIGEVARMLNRKQDTLRKYERRGLLGTSKRFKSKGGKVERRYYTISDIYEIADIFAHQRPVGRPANKKSNSKINRYNLTEGINTRLKEKNGS